MENVRRIQLSICELWRGVSPGRHPVLGLLIRLELLTGEFNTAGGDGRRVLGVLDIAGRFRRGRVEHAERLARYWGRVVEVLEQALRGARASMVEADGELERLRSVAGRRAA